MKADGQLIIGTRGSDLALWQSRWVASQLGRPSELKILTTKGDVVLDRDLATVEGKGFFTKEIEDALLAREIDLAVHSLKDLPTEQPEGLVVAAISKRAPAADLLLVHEAWHDAGAMFPVKSGGTVGASSLRRQAYVRGARADLQPVALRGNVPTRVRKLREGQYAAIVLAEAGLSRLGLDLSGMYAYRLDPNVWLPAPGQGALGIETRTDEVGPVVKAVLHDPVTAALVTAERGLLARFEGGCHLPLGTLANAVDGVMTLSACYAPDPARLVRCVVEGRSPEELVERAHARLTELAAKGEETRMQGERLCVRVPASS